MSYMRDRDALTRGVGAIAATDGSAARRHQRAQMARATGARDRAMSAISRGAMGAIEYAQQVRSGPTYALGALAAMPAPTGLMANLAKSIPAMSRLLPATAVAPTVTMVPLPPPGSPGIAVASLPVTMTPPTPAPGSAPTMTMYPGGASSPVTGTPSDTGVLMGQSQSSSTMAFPDPLPDNIADSGPSPPILGPNTGTGIPAASSSSNTVRNVLIVGGVAAAAYLFLRRRKRGP